MHHTNASQERAGAAAILTSDKVGFGANNITRDKKDHFIMMKESIQLINNIIFIY